MLTFVRIIFSCGLKLYSDILHLSELFHSDMLWKDNRRNGPEICANLLIHCGKVLPVICGRHVVNSSWWLWYKWTELASNNIVFSYLANSCLLLHPKDLATWSSYQIAVCVQQMNINPSSTLQLQYNRRDSGCVSFLMTTCRLHFLLICMCVLTTYSRTASATRVSKGPATAPEPQVSVTAV